jgi:hypothetical protein
MALQDAADEESRSSLLWWVPIYSAVNTMRSILAINVLIYGQTAGFCLSASYCWLLILARIDMRPAHVYLWLFLIAKCWSNLSHEAVCGYRRLILAGFYLSLAIGGYSQSSHGL